MSIICPACETAFKAPPSEIDAARPLQCGVCEHTFVRADAGHVRVEAPSIVPDLSDITVPGDAPVVEPAIAGAAMRADGTEAADAPIRTALPVIIDVPPAEPTVREAVHVDLEPVVARIPRWRWAMPALTASALACVMVVLAARGDIMHHYPVTVGLYQAAGLAPQVPGLAIARVETKRSARDGIRQLIVRGRIENTTRHAIPVPQLKLTVRGEEQAALHAWTVSGGAGALPGGESRNFTAVAQDYPVGAVDVKVTFDRR